MPDTCLCDLSLFLGLVELETGLPSYVTEPQIKVPKPRVTKGFISRSARREQELMKTHQVMNSWVPFTLNQNVEGGVRFSP